MGRAGHTLAGTEFHFAGFEWRDTTAADLDPTLNRNYSMLKGRWLSPDPRGGDVSNPQSLNRYAYALNNPATFVDPLGLSACGSLSNPCNPPGANTGCSSAQDLWGCVHQKYCGMIYCGYQDLGTPDPFDLLLYTACDSEGCGTGFDPNGAAVADILSTFQSPPGNAANSGPVVVQNPCQFQGRALSPGDYATSGQQAANSTTNFVLDVSMGFPAGHYLDPQPLASGNVFQRQAYGNYTFGVYMAGAGVSQNTALSGANTYAFFFSSYPKSTPMDPNYGSLPAASVTNIRNGYNAYTNGTVCHK